jgi:hypothetical protein
MECFLQRRKVCRTTADRAGEVLTEWLAEELPEPVKRHDNVRCWNDARIARIPVPVRAPRS